MGIIKTSKLVHEFIRRDEEGNVESITTALDNVNLDIKEGQFIAILGHNGSGKSTLAKHINALLAPSDGTIWVDGMDVSKEENVIPVRKSAGMVSRIQTIRLSPMSWRRMWALDLRISVCRQMKSGSAWTMH